MHFATRTKVREAYSLTWFWAGACCWPLGPSLGGVLVGADIFAVELVEVLSVWRLLLLLWGDWKYELFSVSDSGGGERVEAKDMRRLVILAV